MGSRPAPGAGYARDGATVPGIRCDGSKRQYHVYLSVGPDIGRAGTHPSPSPALSFGGMRPRLINSGLVAAFICAFGTSVSFYLLLSVVPLSVGGVGAGFATGALMFATVAAELVTPTLLARFGYRRVFAAGMVLLGVPALALPAAHTLPAVLAICA